MANIKSAKKRILVSERNRVRNQAVRSQLRTEIRKFRAALASGDAKAAGTLLPAVHSIIDRTAKKGVIRQGTADRYKSRLAQAYGRLASGGASNAG